MSAVLPPDGAEPPPASQPPSPGPEPGPPASTRTRGVGRWLETRFRSPAAIYGLIVYASFLAIGSDHADDAWDMLDNAAWSLVVFFLAHVFAHTLTDHGEHGLWTATRHAVVHAAGMLYAALPATVVIVVGGMRHASPDDVYEAAMWVTIVVLGLLGYIAYWRRGAHVAIRLLGGLGTALLGTFIILLEYALH